MNPESQGASAPQKDLMSIGILFFVDAAGRLNPEPPLNYTPSPSIYIFMNRLQKFSYILNF